jgi:cyclopropane fatty-acyl-phospholipid synthase-like methyltransferase
LIAKQFGSIRGLRSIELGCGRGDLSVLLAEAGAEVTLLDSSERALEVARRRFDRLGLSARFEQGDMQSRTNSPRHFDLAVSLGVVEHFVGEARSHALRAHIEALRPGGLALISVPYRWCPPYRLWKAYLELRGWWPYGVERPYSRVEIVRRARRAGFTQPITRLFGFWQSVSDHWLRRLGAKEPNWWAEDSPLDRWLGSVLLLAATAPSLPCV